VKWMPLWVVPPLFGLWLLGVDDSFLGSLWGISCGLAYFGWAFLRAIYGKLERKYEVEDDHWRKRETSSAWGGVYVERVTREEEDG